MRGRTPKRDMKQQGTVMRDQLNENDGIPYDGILLDIAANRRTDMNREIIYAYKNKFGRNVKIRPPH